jgi:hypothetical protein
MSCCVPNLDCLCPDCFGGQDLPSNEIAGAQQDDKTVQRSAPQGWAYRTTDIQVRKYAEPNSLISR